MSRIIAFAPIAIGLAALASAPASAQEKGGDSVNMVIIYGEDECPASTNEEIVVCQRMDEGERYRIPEILRKSDDPANVAWAERVRSFETVGNFGTMSCSPSGIGGATGCTQKLIDAAYAEKKGASNVQFSQLIEDERQKRLSTIDEQAAAEQARVEEIERQYMERLEAERQGKTPDESAAQPAEQAEPTP